jgi:tRNA-5-methyluridine54 2-sulfurtransferase
MRRPATVPGVGQEGAIVRVRLRNPDREVELEGPRRVDEVLEELEVNPTTVLVIRDGELVPGSTMLEDADDIEVRSVISGGDGTPRCVTCRGPAVIEEPRHRSAWCGAHFVDHVHRQVRNAIDQPGPEGHLPPRQSTPRMFSYADRILVAVSGGKDSLALWDALLTMGYRADGLYLGLGIGGYSDRSGRVCRNFAAARGADLIEVDLAEEHGYSIPQASRVADRATCGTCGLSKRYVFNRAAVEGGYDVVVTGHNLDDEAATLLGNVLRWQEGFLRRQRPLLPASGANQVRKAKPLYRLSEREMAAYCLVRGIDYVVEECPLVEGNTGMELKDALNLIEEHAPGTKAQFLFGFLDRAALFDASPAAGGGVELVPCLSCGMPTTRPAGTDGPECAFCRQRRRLTAQLPVAQRAATSGTR